MGIFLSRGAILVPSNLWVGVAEVMASLGPNAFQALSVESKARLIDALRRLLRYSQNGFEVGWQYTVSSPSIRSAIATLILANVFRPWAAVGWKGRTAEALTEMSGSGADVELISTYSPCISLKTPALSSRPTWAICIPVALSLSNPEVYHSES